MAISVPSSTTHPYVSPGLVYNPTLTTEQGSTPSLFVGTTAFEVIVKQQIRRLEEPGLRCCSLVYDELIRILGQLLAKTVSAHSFLAIVSDVSQSAFKRYPELKERFNLVVINFFKSAMQPTNKLVSDMVA